MHLKTFAIPITALASALVLCASVCWAHDFWLLGMDAQPGEPIKLVAGYGHAMPTDEVMKADQFAPIYIIGPKGAKTPCSLTGEMELTAEKALPKGSYIAVGGKKISWWTKTPDGSQDKPKDQVKDAGKCYRSVKYAKCIVNLGGAVGDVSRPVGQDVEIVPMSNPGLLKGGGVLRVRVLYKGKPLPKAEVKATFEGFSTERGAYAFVGRTNEDGEIKVTMLKGGNWLITTGHKQPFPDQKKCDVLSESASLAFVVK